MIPPFAPHAAFCPIRVFIPSVNSKQPVRQQAVTQGMGPEGISRVVNQGLARLNCQGFLPWTVARDGRFCHSGICGPSLDHHHGEVQILEDHLHVSLRWTASRSHMEWRIRSPSQRGDMQLGIPPILAHCEQPK